MRILDKTWLTDDEGRPMDVVKYIEREIKALKLDTCNERYVVRVTVDRVDERPAEDDDDDI